MPHQGVECPDDPQTEAVFQSVCSAFYASVHPTEGLQAEQVMTRMEVVVDNVPCSREAPAVLAETLCV